MRDLPGWPMADLSHQIAHGPHLWHVQETGTGPTLLLLHGAGASTHSWRGIVPRLAHGFHIIALDLPGQGFCRAGGRRRSSLDAMTADIAALCAFRGWKPRAIVGHSAGAALGLQLSLNLRPVPDLIGINPALGRFPGVAGWLFPVLAKMLALNPLTSVLFTLGGDPQARARRLIDGSGSTLDSEGYALYGKLISDRSHVDGTLNMMAQWDLGPLIDRLSQIETRCLFLTGTQDTTVPPEVATRAASDLRHARVIDLPGLGHLAHEEAPETIAPMIASFLTDPD